MALDIETRTALIPLPQPDEQEQRLRLFDTLITDGSLQRATRRLFHDGHYAHAVTEAYKVVNNTVKTKANTPAKDGHAMMLAVFEPTKPILRINLGKTQSDRDEQDGYKFMFAGVMLGIRNPRSHLTDVNDEAAVALEMLVMANHLLRVVGRAKKAPRGKAAPSTA